MKTIVLMYHGLYIDEESLLATISEEDRPYAINKDTFNTHLEMIKAQLNDANNQHNIVITFDDGHISNHSIALPSLLEHGLNAYFFVTTTFMRSREHFCRAQELKELHDSGMIIGSHGVSHRFLDADIPEKELKLEFLQSKATLEKAIGSRIDSVSFPGGRYIDLTLKYARSSGLTKLFGSDVGINEDDKFDHEVPVFRVAIRNTTSDIEFQKIISANKKYYTKSVTVAKLKYGLRTILGNKLYHELYKLVTRSS